MKDVKEGVIGLIKTGYCTPKLSAIARKLGVPVTTVQYNIKRLEEEGVVREYKAVLDHSKIGEGFCCYVLVSLSPDEYGDPERIADLLAHYPQVESIDIITGDWEVILKVRVKDMDEYYKFIKSTVARKGIVKITSLSSLRQVKNEFILNKGNMKKKGGM